MTITADPTYTASVEELLGDYVNWQRHGTALQPPAFFEAPAKRKSRKTRERKDVVLKMPDTAISMPHGGYYIPRMWGTHADVTVLQEARAKAWEPGPSGGTRDFFPFLYGPPGTGKTVAAIAAFPDEIITEQVSGETEVADLLGQWVQLADKSIVWRDGSLVRAMEGDGERGWVLLIDEIALADPKVLSAVYSAMDGRREITLPANPDRGVIQAKPGFFVIACTNPDAPGARMSEALLSRFRLHVEIGTDWTLARKLGVDSQVVTVMSNMDRKRKAGAVMWSPQLREALSFRDTADVFGFDFAVQNLLSVCPEDDRAELKSILERTLGKSDIEHLVAGEQAKSLDEDSEADEAETEEVLAE